VTEFRSKIGTTTVLEVEVELEKGALKGMKLVYMDAHSRRRNQELEPTFPKSTNPKTRGITSNNRLEDGCS